MTHEEFEKWGTARNFYNFSCGEVLGYPDRTWLALEESNRFIGYDFVWLTFDGHKFHITSFNHMTGQATDHYSSPYLETVWTAYFLLPGRVK